MEVMLNNINPCSSVEIVDKNEANGGDGNLQGKIQHIFTPVLHLDQSSEIHIGSNDHDEVFELQLYNINCEGGDTQQNAPEQQQIIIKREDIEVDNMVKESSNTPKTAEVCWGIPKRGQAIIWINIFALF